MGVEVTAFFDFCFLFLGGPQTVAEEQQEKRAATAQMHGPKKNESKKPPRKQRKPCIPSHALRPCLARTGLLTVDTYIKHSR